MEDRHVVYMKNLNNAVKIAIALQFVNIKGVNQIAVNVVVGQDFVNINDSNFHACCVKEVIYAVMENESRFAKNAKGVQSVNIIW